MEKILDNTGKLLAVIVSPSQWKRGLDFITEDEEFIKWVHGTMIKVRF